MSLISGSTFFLVMRIAGAGLTYTTYLLLARWMGKAELGTYVAAFAWCLVLTQIVTLGFQRSALRFIAEGLGDPDTGKIHGFIGWTRRIVVRTSVAVAALVALSLSIGGGDAARLVGVLSMPILAWVLLHSGLALAFSWKMLFAVPAVLRVFGLLLGVCIFFFTTGSITALTVMLIHAGAILVIAVGYSWLLRARLAAELAPAPPRYETRSWISASVPLLLIALSGTYFFDYNVIFLSGMLPAEAIGVFGVAHKVAFLLGFVIVAVDTASLPRLARLHSNPATRRQVQAELTRATRVKALTCAVGFLGLVFLGKPLLGVFGSGFDEGYGVMLLIAASILARAVIGPVAELLGLTGHHNVSLGASAAGLVAAPVLVALLVPWMGLPGGALAILIVTVATNLSLSRLMRYRLRLSASALGPNWIVRLRRRLGHRDVRVNADERKAFIEVCTPERVRKIYPVFTEEEFVKARALHALGIGAPQPLRRDGSAIEFEYVAIEETLKDCYLDYMTTDDAAGHRMLDLMASAGRALARIHDGLDLPHAEEWRPSRGFVRDMRRCGFAPERLQALPSVPLHGDFCLQNLSPAGDGLAVFDASADYVSTFHPLTRGPAYVDLSLLLSCIEGRVSVLQYPRIEWQRVPPLREVLIGAYNEHASHPVDGRLAHAFGFCLAREFYRADSQSNLVARAASWVLYNGLKGNDPRARGRQQLGGVSKSTPGF